MEASTAATVKAEDEPTPEVPWGAAVGDSKPIRAALSLDRASLLHRDAGAKPCGALGKPCRVPLTTNSAGRLMKFGTHSASQSSSPGLAQV